MDSLVSDVIMVIIVMRKMKMVIGQRMARMARMGRKKKMFLDENKMKVAMMARMTRSSLRG